MMTFKQRTMALWIQKWKVPSSSGDSEYTVSVGQNGEWGCSCKHWIHRRTDCRHIKEKRAEVAPFYIANDQAISSKRKSTFLAKADTFLRVRNKDNETKSAKAIQRRAAIPESVPVIPSARAAPAFDSSEIRDITRVVSLDDDF